MAVVINDMEVAPQPAAAEQQSQGSTDAGSKDPMKELTKMLHIKHERSHRLEAY